jgi:hypothetical protein
MIRGVGCGSGHVTGTVVDAREWAFYLAAAYNSATRAQLITPQIAAR